MKEVKVYYIDINKSSPKFNPNKCNPSEFIKEAEKQGNVFTMEEFQRGFNGFGANITTDGGYIRFIEEEQDYFNNDWAETHHAIVEEITIIQNSEDRESDAISNARDSNGTGGVWELGINLTNEFQKIHKDTKWGDLVDYYDTLEEFLNKKLK